MTDGVALDGAYRRSQAKEALDTFFAPLVSLCPPGRRD
jgi:hypothetical protein